MFKTRGDQICKAYLFPLPKCAGLWVCFSGPFLPFFSRGLTVFPSYPLRSLFKKCHDGRNGLLFAFASFSIVRRGTYRHIFAVRNLFLTHLLFCCSFFFLFFFRRWTSASRSTRRSMQSTWSVSTVAVPLPGRPRTVGTSSGSSSAFPVQVSEVGY